MDQHVDEPQPIAAQDDSAEHDGLDVAGSSATLAVPTGGVGLMEVSRWAPPTQEPALDPELVAILCGEAEDDDPSSGDVSSGDASNVRDDDTPDAHAERAPTDRQETEREPMDSEGPLDGGAGHDASNGVGDAGGEASEHASEGEADTRSETEAEAETETETGSEHGDATADADDGEDPDDATEPVDPAELVRSAAALLFASPEALGSRRLADLLGAKPSHVATALSTLSERFAASELPFVVREVAGGWRLFTDPEMADVVQRLDSTRRTEKISPAGLETLSIIAYRQPVTKAEIEAIRGVQAGPMLRTLVDRGLVKVTGRADQPGSPLLYGTTADFLDRFGLASLDDLPRDGELARD